MILFFPSSSPAQIIPTHPKAHGHLWSLSAFFGASPSKVRHTSAPQSSTHPIRWNRNSRRHGRILRILPEELALGHAQLSAGRVRRRAGGDVEQVPRVLQVSVDLLLSFLGTRANEADDGAVTAAGETAMLQRGFHGPVRRDVCGAGV